MFKQRKSRPVATGGVTNDSGLQHDAIVIITHHALARLDAVCSRLAVLTDRLAALAAARDDGKIALAALEAEAVCVALHSVYADLATLECEVR